MIAVVPAIMPEYGTPAFDLVRAMYIIIFIIAIIGSIHELTKLRKKRELIQNWIKWQATVLLLEFIDGEGVNMRMRIRYQYAYQGKTYIGRTATFADLEDKPGWFLVDTDTTSYLPKEYDRMRTAQKNEEPFDIWINPDCPSQSIITNVKLKGSEVAVIIMSVIAAAVMYWLIQFEGWK